MYMNQTVFSQHYSANQGPLDLIMYTYLYEVTGNPDCVRSSFWGWPKSCCTPENPCIIGQGDCLYDDGCLGDLICVRNSCPSSLLGADCCQEGIYINKKNCVSVLLTRIVE